jgi:hypothetical protein
MRFAILLAAGALIGAGGAAYADKGSRQEQAACRPDVRRLCGHIGGGDEQKYRECLQAHISELSQKCRQVLMKHQNQQ